MSSSPFKIRKSPHTLGAIAPEPAPAPPQALAEVVAAVAPQGPAIQVPTAHAKAITRAVMEAHLPDWKVREGQKITPLNTSTNLAALMHLGAWKARYNEMTRRTELVRDGALVPRDDDLNTNLTLLGDWAVLHGLARETVAELVDAIARGDTYHPVRDWITAVPWDGVDRRELFLNTLELADPSSKPLAARLLHKWMLQGIGALMEPEGLTATGMLVLAGLQFAGKTWWVRHLVRLAGAISEGVTIDPSDKDSVLRAIATFITEVGEMDGTMRKADIAVFKGFVTNNVDEVRLPYARRSSFFKRRTILAGTVNGTGFLVDETGNRRFWVIDVIRCHVLDAETMQQVWAQYLHLYRQGERWNLEPDLLEALNAANRRHETIDPLAERIGTAFDWSSVDMATVTEDNRSSHPDLVWLTATRVCDLAGVRDPNKSAATKAAHIVKTRWEIQGHLSGNLGKVALMDRRSNGTRLLAVPKKRAFMT